MLSKAELLNEIAALEAQEASWQNCERLAALYIIRWELFGNSEQLKVLPVSENQVTYDSGTEFSQVIHGMDSDRAWAVMDELMDKTLRIINPRLYNGVLAELS